MSFNVFTLAVTSSPSLPSPRVAPLTSIAVFVAQRHRQAVDLRLGGKGDLLVVVSRRKRRMRPTKSTTSVFGERVVERQHRHRVPHLGEARRRRRRRRVGSGFPACAVAGNAPRSPRSAGGARHIRHPRPSARLPDNSAGRARRFPLQAARARRSPAFRSNRRRAFRRSFGAMVSSFRIPGPDYIPPRGSGARRRRGLRR